MKITKNTSLYETKKLKSLFCLIHKQLAKYEGRMSWWDDLNISIQYKTYDYSGRAFLKLPRHKTWGMFLSMSKDLTLDEVSQLFAHELMHTYGYRHHQFNTDPLTQDQLDQIASKFKQQDLLKPEAFDVKTPVRKNYETLFTNLASQYSWMNVYVKHGYNSEREIEVFDDRLDFEHFYDHWLYTYTDVTTTWYQAYKLAQKLIKGDIQKKLTENWTVGLNPEWEEE